jgi:uncharacterized Rossmann fold enzyme
MKIKTVKTKDFFRILKKFNVVVENNDGSKKKLINKTNSRMAVLHSHGDNHEIYIRVVKDTLIYLGINYDDFIKEL